MQARPSTSSLAIRPEAATTSGRGCSRANIGKHIPGKPVVVPKNTPGAGSFLAVNTRLRRVAEGWHPSLAIGAPTTRA